MFSYVPPGEPIDRRSSRGWCLDVEGWWCRPFYRRDLVLLSLPAAVLQQLRGAPMPAVQERVARVSWVIGSGEHAFVGENGWLYCRNAKQKRRLDNGKVV